MLSKKVKEKIEEVYQDRIVYAKQCTSLAAAISAKVKSKISPTTVKRLWGFVPGTDTARLWTLDLIAQYCNYDNWSSLIADLLGANVEEEPGIEVVTSKNLKHGTRFRVEFGRLPFMEIEFIGKNNFRVMKEEKTGLRVGDVIEVVKIERNLPILVKKILRENLVMSSTIVGTVTGTTQIRLLNN